MDGVLSEDETVTHAEGRRVQVRETVSRSQGFDARVG
jgi:hypothetical protein